MKERESGQGSAGDLKIGPEERVRDFTRSCARAGLLTDDQLRAEVSEAIVAELPDRAGSADELARSLVDEAREALVGEQDGWPEATDYDRLQTAFSELETLDIVVLQGVEDHWSAKAELERRGADGRLPAGVVWFTPPDVWHAIDEGMLEVNLWHASTANAAPGDELLDDTLTVFDKHGIPAHFDEGRVEVAARWQKRIAGHPR
ncbi:MAG: hypothetical protein M3393_09270 [Actinomycetota bacterium]|nr:hypothetical protein [Actinomycetota bacterium]